LLQAYVAFKEVQLPRLRRERPGLKGHRLKEVLVRMWSRSPQNPLNQPAQAMGVGAGGGGARAGFRAKDRDGAQIARSARKFSHRRDPRTHPVWEGEGDGDVAVAWGGPASEVGPAGEGKK